jgi:hypothetical protein
LESASGGKATAHSEGLVAFWRNKKALSWSSSTDAPLKNNLKILLQRTSCSHWYYHNRSNDAVAPHYPIAFIKVYLPGWLLNVHGPMQ